MGLFSRSWLSKARSTINRAKRNLHREIKRPKRDLAITDAQLTTMAEHQLGINDLLTEVRHLIETLESHATPAPKRAALIRTHAPLETLHEIQHELEALLKHYFIGLDRRAKSQEEHIESLARIALSDSADERPQFLLSIIGRLEHLEHHPPPAAAQADIDELVKDLHAIDRAILEHKRLEAEENRHSGDAQFHAFLEREEHADTHGELKHLEQLRDRLRRFFADHHIKH